MTLWLIIWTAPDDAPLGAVIVEAITFATALDYCDMLNLTPEGDVASMDTRLPPGSVDLADMNRLLTPKEATAIRRRS